MYIFALKKKRRKYVSCTIAHISMAGAGLGCTQFKI